MDTREESISVGWNNLGKFFEDKMVHHLLSGNSKKFVWGTKMEPLCDRCEEIDQFQKQDITLVKYWVFVLEIRLRKNKTKVLVESSE